MSRILLVTDAWGAAETMQMADKVGNLAPGLEADVIVIDLESTPLIEARMRRAEDFKDALFAQIVMADDRAIEHHRSAAMGRRVGTVDFQRYQFACRTVCHPGSKRCLSDEIALVHFDESAKPRLERIELGQHVGFPVQITLFKPHGFDRPGTE